VCIWWIGPIRIDRYTVTMFPSLNQNVLKYHACKSKGVFPLKPAVELSVQNVSNETRRSHSLVPNGFHFRIGLYQFGETPPKKREKKSSGFVFRPNQILKVSTAGVNASRLWLARACVRKTIIRTLSITNVPTRRRHGDHFLERPIQYFLDRLYMSRIGT
jgi:hypothetical protein